VHVILDNFSIHKTDLVKHYLEQHPNVTLHFTPTYSSWLNQVESWFSKLQRDVIDRGIFTSVADLKRKILRFYQKTAQPFQWKYSDVRKRIPVVAMSQGQPTSLAQTGTSHLAATVR
jgi:transposase